MAVGVWFYCLSTDRYLYLLRADTRHANSWGLPGGKVESGESLLAAMRRECEEEIGYFPTDVRMIPLEQFTSADGQFSYHTFFCCVAQEFQPTLNHEHIGYAWIHSGTWPRPMHPGLWNTINIEEVRSKIDQIKQQFHTSQ